MGVAGSGKTAVGMQVARKLDWIFLDADDFHPPANIEKMKHGIPLNDQDRAPWLQRLHDELQDQIAKEHSVILACSALKESYRNVLRDEVIATEIYLSRRRSGDNQRQIATSVGSFFPERTDGKPVRGS